MGTIKKIGDPWSGTQQSPLLTAGKYISIIISGLLLLFLYYNLSFSIYRHFNFLIILYFIFGFLIGYIVADFITGTVHWFCDTFFNGTTPVIGQSLIQPFRDHHTFPQRITQHKFVEQDTVSVFAMFPLLAYLAFLGPEDFANGKHMFWGAFTAGLSTGLFLTNLFHKWAHADKVSGPVQVLQKAGLILGPAKHRRHHRHHDTAFCVTSGWLNPVLDKIEFYSRLEQLIRFFQRNLARGR